MNGEERQMNRLVREQPPSNNLHGQAREDKRVMILVLISAVMIAVTYFLFQANTRFLYILSNGLPPLLALASFITAVAGLHRNGVRTNDRLSMIWFGYSLGVLFWFLGESTWAVYTLWYSIPVPFPSPADGFWLAGYIPLMCAMASQGWQFREFFSSRKMLAAILAVVVLGALLLAVLVPPSYASETEQDWVSLVVSLAYPLLDVGLLVVALPILFLFGKGSFWRPFLFVTLGLIMTFIGDILFSWATLNNIYYNGSYLELFFHWAYLILAYGFYLRLRHGRQANMLE